MTATKVRIVMNPAYRQILAANPSVQLVVRSKAEEAAGIARDLAPVATGAYRDSIQVEQEGSDALLVATDFKAHWIEWGTIRTRAFATLRSAAQRVARIIEN